MPFLSIIIPVYNVEKYLAECLDSVINQTYKNIEIICVNDGSTDGSLKIIQDYAQYDNRIKIVNQKNSGQATARNAGLSVASGDYVTFVDADDKLALTAYEKSLSVISNVDVVCFEISVFGDVHKDKRHADNEYYKVKYSGKCILDNEKRKSTDCSVCNKIFRKSIIDKFNISFPEGLFYEDAAFYWEYIVNAQMAYYIDESLYYYRRRIGSTMDKTFKNSEIAIDHLYVSEFLYRYFLSIDKLKEYTEVFLELFEAFFFLSYNYTSKKKRKIVLSEATRIAKSLNLPENYLIKCLKDQKYQNIDGILYLSFWQKIFSIKNVKSHKVYTLLGLQLKVRDKVLVEKEKRVLLERQVKDMAKTIDKLTQQQVSQSTQLEFLTLKVEELCR